MRKKYIIGSILVALMVGAGYFIFFFNSKAPEAQVYHPSTKPAEQQNTPNVSTPKPKTFNKKLYSLDDPASIWVVANKTRPLQPKSYAPSDLVSVGNGQRMRAEAATALKQLFASAKTAGYTLKSLSGYRSYGTQVSVYNNEVKTYGQAVADSESARPGTSEHQTGLAIDVGGGGCGIEDCFGNTAAGKWLANNAYQHGFIIRYPQGKTSITGYRYEPWHIRYIGAALATEMHNTNVQTLEEFFNLPAAPSYTN